MAQVGDRFHDGEPAHEADGAGRRIAPGSGPAAAPRRLMSEAEERRGEEAHAHETEDHLRARRSAGTAAPRREPGAEHGGERDPRAVGETRPGRAAEAPPVRSAGRRHGDSGEQDDLRGIGAPAAPAEPGLEIGERRIGDEPHERKSRIAKPEEDETRHHGERGEKVAMRAQGKRRSEEQDGRDRHPGGEDAFARA